MQVKIMAEGGSMKPGPSLSQQLGPAGVNINKVIEKVNEATRNFKGMKVPVELDINTSTKEFEVKVFSPPIAELLKGELGIQKGSGEQKKFNPANASIEQIISVARIKMSGLLDKNLKSAVKSTLGSCVSLGILVENKLAKQVEQEVDEGKYDDLIKKEITETPLEKKQQLQDFFDNLKKEQDRLMKQEAAVKAAADEKAAKKAAKPAAPAAPAKKK